MSNFFKFMKLYILCSLVTGFLIGMYHVLTNLYGNTKIDIIAEFPCFFVASGMFCLPFSLFAFVKMNKKIRHD